MSFAYGTLIAGPDGFQPIETYKVGDEALGASTSAAQPSWAPQSVALSEGLPPSPYEATMIFVRYGDDNSLIVTASQSFLLIEGTLMAASSLAPGDRLTGADGSPVPVLEMAGRWQNGIHDIALAPMAWNGSSNGHLLNAGGIIAGDYVADQHEQERAQRGAPRPRPGPLAYD
jgi:hypothetical protein